MTDEEVIEGLAANMLDSLTGGESQDELEQWFSAFMFGAIVTAKMLDRKKLGEMIEDTLDLRMHKNDPTWREWIEHLNRFAPASSRWDIHKSRLIGPYSTHPPGGRSKTGMV